MERLVKTCDSCGDEIEHGTDCLRVIMKREGPKGVSHIGEIDVCKKCEEQTDMRTYVHLASRGRKSAKSESTTTNQ